MRQALTEFLREVRAAGVPFSLAESIDALRAATVVGVGREPLREALAAAIVKDEVDRAAFDEVFERFFSAAEARRKRRRRSEPSGEGAGARGGAGAAEPQPERHEKREPLSTTAREAARRRGPAPEVQQRRRRRELLRKPFRDMEATDAEELTALAADLAGRFRVRLARRFRRGRRGRLDFRRTLRRSIAHGGAAFDLVLRRRRPARPDLVALCDLSGSVRHAADFFASVLLPCSEFFRRVRFFGFVDQPVEASLEGGRLVPDDPIDFHAFSDFGRVFVTLESSAAAAFTRGAVVLVLGDARNNRRPPRADALARLRARVRAVWWLIPEARSLWGRGDSAIASYRPHCDELLECSNGVALLAALDRLAR